MNRKIKLTVYLIDQYGEKLLAEPFEVPIVPNVGDWVIITGMSAMQVHSRRIDYSTKNIDVAIRLTR